MNTVWGIGIIVMTIWMSAMLDDGDLGPMPIIGILILNTFLWPVCFIGCVLYLFIKKMKGI